MNTNSNIFKSFFSDEKALMSATPAQISDAKAFEECYNWYITEQKVLPENAILASKIFIQKYALHDEEGNCLEQTPPDMWNRIAKTLAEEEIKTNPINKDYNYWFKEFRDLLDEWKYTPQGSGLYALGNPYVKASASNCFVLSPPNDSLESIFDTAKDMATIYKMRGGVGIDISNLRPAGAVTSNSSKTSTGAASFMDFYSKVTSTVGQQGRRGALLQSIRVDHPDIFSFIEEKQDLDKQWFFNELSEYGINLNDWKYSSIADRLKSTSYANISVKLTDKFIKAVEEDSDFELWYEFEDNKYPRISKYVKAKDIWNKLMYGAWASAEPGIFNWDLMIRESIGDCYGKVEYNNIQYDFSLTTSNPCGELIMSPDSCSLGTHFLPAFIVNPYTSLAYFDYDKFIKTIKLSTRAQDNIKNWDLSLKNILLPIHKIAGELGRRIGLGCHGLSDAIAMLGIRFDSDKALIEIEKIYETLKNTAYQTSVELGLEKGVFPIFDWEKEKDNPFLNRLDPTVLNNIRLNGRRNISILTNAPTGSISILSRNCSSGIEPCFMKVYNRNVKKPGTNDFEQHSINHQAVQDCISLCGDPSIFIESHEMIGTDRIKIQAIIQKHIDHSISVTTNLPETATVENVSDLYLTAFKSGCKGFTIYREGSRGSILETSKKEIKSKLHKIIERPKTTNIDIHKVKYRDKQWAVLVGTILNNPIEVFAGIEEDTPLPNKYHRAELVKKSRGHYSLTVYLSEDEDDIIKINNIGARFPLPEGMALTRFISLSLRNGVTVSDICEQLSKSSNSMFDYPAVLNRVLKNYITEEEYSIKIGDKPCPDCGSSLKVKKQDGCMMEYCTNCTFTYSKCN